MRRAAAFLTLLIALILPGPALGQSAGDEQYSDPFGPEEQQQQEQPQAPAEPVPAEPAPADPAPAPAPESTAEPSGEVATAPAQSGDPSLPATGLPALSMLIIGAGMFAAGAVVRRRL